MKKYYNAIVGVAIVGVFVLGLTISGSAGNILASVSNLVGSQTAQVTASPTCSLPSSTATVLTANNLFTLKKFLNRMAYTPYGNSGVIAPGMETGSAIDQRVKNALLWYQLDAGLNVNKGSDGKYDPKLDTPTLTHMNSQLRADIDCMPNDVENSPYYFSQASGFPANDIGEYKLRELQPGQKISPAVFLKERADNSPATAAEGYRVSTIIYKDSNGLFPQSKNFVSGVTVNAEEVTGSSFVNWQADVNVPTQPGSYVLRMLVRCAIEGSKCDQAYGKDQNSKSIVVPFKVGSPIQIKLDIIGGVKTDAHKNPIPLRWQIVDSNLVGVTAISLKWHSKLNLTDPDFEAFKDSPLLVREFANPNTSGSYDLYLPKGSYNGTWRILMKAKTSSGSITEAYLGDTAGVSIDSVY